MSKYKLFCDKCLKEEVYDEFDIVGTISSDMIRYKCPYCGNVNEVPKIWAENVLKVDKLEEKSEKDKDIIKKEYVITAQRQIISGLWIFCWALLGVIIILLLIHNGI